MLPMEEQPEDSEDNRGAAAAAAGKRKRSDLKHLLCSITSEKKGADNSGTRQDSSTPTIPTDKLNGEITDYKLLTDISPAEDPLTWWSQHEVHLPILAHFTKQYLCIPASSCASEHVFSTSGNICSPRHSRLTEEHLFSWPKILTRQRN